MIERVRGLLSPSVPPALTGTGGYHMAIYKWVLRDAGQDKPDHPALNPQNLWINLWVLPESRLDSGATVTDD